MWDLLKRYYLILLFPITSCVEPYNISDVSYNDNLVVEGCITTEVKQQQVKISHTSRNGEQKFIPERSAIVVITTGLGEKFAMNEISPGVYQSKVLRGTIGQTYALSITTSGGKQYSSPAVELKKNPG